MDFASFSAKILKNVLQIKRLKWVDLHPTCVSNTGTPASIGGALHRQTPCNLKRVNAHAILA